MNSAKLESIDTLALRHFQSRKGSMKVDAAFGELFAADRMVNLCSANGVWNAEPYTDADRRRVEEVDAQVHAQVNEAMAAFAAADDPKAASARLVPVLLTAAEALRSLLKGVDFYDDAVVDPYPAWPGWPGSRDPGAL